jgi:hypothetical protein
MEKEVIPTKEEIRAVLVSLESRMERERRSSQWGYLLCAAACAVAIWSLVGVVRMLEISVTASLAVALFAALRNRK